MFLKGHTMETVRFGLAGAGVVGEIHCQAIAEVEGARLAAVCDLAREKAEALADGTGARVFSDYRAMIDSGEVDAVIVATPHTSHPEIALCAFEKGLHVLCEKPLAVHVNAAKTMLEAAAGAPVKFGAVFQKRTTPTFRKAKELIDGGELGELHRAIWIITKWFRTQAYYDQSSWRGTWGGEGGGVLLNQCPHDLDLYQWLVGMPRRVRAFAQFGRYHAVEVEDDVTALMEWDSGMTGVFVASTGEYPGTNRLEITGDRGRMVLEDGKISLDRTTESVRDYLRTTREISKGPAVDQIELPATDEPGKHVAIIRNFVAAILRDELLIVPGEEGINSLELANAMVLSGVREETITLPLDGDAYEQFLRERITASRRPVS